MARSGRAATKVPEPRMEHGLNTERESALMALEKEEITEKISSQLHLKGRLWESVFHPCSIRGSPENLRGNERFLLLVVRIDTDFERHEFHEFSRILSPIRANSCNSCLSGLYPCLSVSI